VFNLHGTGSWPDQQASLSRLDQLADAGMVVVAPPGVIQYGRGYRFDLEADVDFLACLLTQLEQRWPVAAKRVMAAGLSNGARMACAWADRQVAPICAIAAVAGLRAPRPPLVPLRRPLSVIAFHGSSDRINRYGGDPKRPEWRESVPEAAIGWARYLGHDLEPVSEVSTGVETLTFGATSTHPVVLHTLARVGHAWPGSSGLNRLPWVPAGARLDATSMISQFFASQLEP
jgi:polyhydroxybutyrate depolymerase